MKQVASKRAKRTLWLVAATKLVCPLLPRRSFGGQRQRFLLRLLGKYAVTDTLQVVDDYFSSSAELAKANRRQAVATVMSSITEALISEVFKRRVPLNHRNKNYKFFDNEWKKLSQTLNTSSKYHHIEFAFGLSQIYVQIYRTEFMCLHNVITARFP